MKIKKISFKDVAKLSDSYTVVLALALTEEEYDEALKDMNEVFGEKHKLITGKITSLKRIDGNVLGDEGRHDYLMTYSKGNEINPLLIMASRDDIMFVSDFVRIYGEDFIQ